jgi:hypothetical protein
MSLRSPERGNQEEEALNYIRAEGSVSRDAIMEELDLQTYEEASDILRRLRYRGEVGFSFDGEFFISDSDE